MSTAEQTTGPLQLTDKFTAIFKAAENEYQRITGNSLDTHPFAKKLRSCDNPRVVSIVFQTQADIFSTFCKGDKELMALLDPTIHILFTFSDTLGEVIGLVFSPAKIIFTGIGVLLTAARGVMADNETLIDLFERIQFFLQRLQTYIGIPLTNGLTELLGKIMAQMLHILALSTKAMTESRIKKFSKKLLGRTDVDDALLRLDKLTNEESLMAVAKNLEIACRVEGKVQVIESVAHSIEQAVKALRERTDELQWNQLQEKLQTWLSPPNPSINQNSAWKIRHGETANWFIRSSTYREWKANGSLLWIRGNPGAGKSILCSAIIEDIKDMREDRSALVAFHYFDFKDASKRHVRGLLASLLFQLCDDSDRCRDILHQLFITCRKGSEQPSDAALTKCLKTILELPGQLPIFITIDALDECPSTTGTPSPREDMLDFVEDLAKSNCSHLFICVTSRPELDIRTVLDPLTSPSCRVSLHEESGQREDINNYICSFVNTDRAMRKWRREDKELAIKILSERAGGMFRWVYCQLDTLRRCLPSSIRKTLNELPTTLDETYERTFEGIPKEMKQHAHRLFQCLVAAIRPFRVEELAEMFAIRFDQDAAYDFMEGWRPEDPEEAILSACSTLITVIDNKGPKVVQFSHFSVKEFLVSERLRTFEVGNIRDFHIHLDAAHTILAHACIAVLLQLDEKTDKQRIATYPLASYAAQHWFNHAKYQNVASQVQGAMEQLLNPSRPHLAAWVWLHDMDGGPIRRSIGALEDHPCPLKATTLCYAMPCGLIEYLIFTHVEDVNAKCGAHGTLLHVASRNGDFNAVSVLLDHGADVNSPNEHGRTPLCEAYSRRHLKVMGLLLDHGAAVDVQYDKSGPLIHDALFSEEAEVIRLLLQRNADPNITALDHCTPLHYASSGGNAVIAQIFVEHGADINALSESGTPLFHASLRGHLHVARLLIQHGADMHIQAPRRLTPLQVARKWGLTQMAWLLLDNGAKDNGGPVASTDDVTLGGRMGSADNVITLHTEKTKGPVTNTGDGLRYFTLHALDPFWFTVTDLVFSVMLWVILTEYL